MLSHARAMEASKDPLAALGPGRVVISVEEDERRRADSLCVSDLMSRVNLLRNDFERNQLRQMNEVLFFA